MPTDSQTLQAGRAFVDEAWGRVMQSYASDNTVLSPTYLEGMQRFMQEPTLGVARAVIRMVEALFANPDILYARLLDVSREEACGASLLAWATALDDGSLREAMTKHA